MASCIKSVASPQLHSEQQLVLAFCGWWLRRFTGFCFCRAMPQSVIHWAVTETGELAFHTDLVKNLLWAMKEIKYSLMK